MTSVNKAGTILINKETKKIGLIHRTKQNDYSFPKGHQESNEDIISCAIRETEEETQRCVEIREDELACQTYVDSRGDECNVHWFIANDLGQSEKKFDEDLKHTLMWVDIDEVEKLLTYDNLKELFLENKAIIQRELNL